MDMEKRRKMMESNYLKRNVYISKLIQGYHKDFMNYKYKQIKLDKRNSEGKNE